MIVSEIRVLPLGKINTIAIPRFMLNPNTADRYYFDDLLNMPYIREIENADNKTYYDFIAVKINPVIKSNSEKEYITLERTPNCMKYTIKSKIYEKRSLIKNADNVKVKVYSHDEKETELCNWTESNKEPEAFILYWKSNYFGFLEKGSFYSYQAFKSKDRGYYLFLLPAKDNILQIGKEQIKITVNNNSLEAQII